VVLEGGATTFPVPMARGATWDPQLEERIGEAIAREARSFGANWAGVVCVNLLRHPGWGRAQETYGEDPVLLGALGAAMTRGVQRHAVACVKHFALNSIDSSRFLVDVRASARALHELYLPHFRDCVEAGAGSVMTAYNRVNGEWCSQNAELLDAILKRRWGFSGFVVTDFIFGLRDGVAGLLAGLDLEMPFRMILSGCVPKAVADGRLPMARIEDAVQRQLRAQLAVPVGNYPEALRGCPAHRALARCCPWRAFAPWRCSGPWRRCRISAIGGLPIPVQPREPW
jgi:beta-glucosidase